MAKKVSSEASIDQQMKTIGAKVRELRREKNPNYEAWSYLNGVNKYIKDREEIVKLLKNTTDFTNIHKDSQPAYVLLKQLGLFKDISTYRNQIKEIDEKLKNINKNTIITVKLKTIKFN